MNDAPRGRLLALHEQCGEEVWLSEEDAALLRALDFDLLRLAEADATGVDLHAGQACFLVNPKQYVAHLALPSGDVLRVEPKIHAANVFRMLAYVYARCRPDVFRDAEVSYATGRSLFEPLVELFNDLVATRARRGLVQDYVRHEQNLGVMRGRILLERQVTTNAVRPDHLFCRYYQQTPDIEDNQILKWTLWCLASLDDWSERTARFLRVCPASVGNGESVLPLR